MERVPLMLWLAIGGVLSIFSIGKWSVAVAAWLAPTFLLHFTHAKPSAVGLAWVWLALYIPLFIASRGVVPLSGVAYAVSLAIIITLEFLPYVADRLLAPRLPGFLSTLVFPLAMTVVEFVINSSGAFFSIAYTQYGNLPLMQLASVTGIWGITFLVTWFGAVLNWGVENGVGTAPVQQGLLVYAAVWSLVMLTGGARLVFSETATKTVRVATIGWPDGILELEEMSPLLEPAIPETEREQFRQRFQRLHDYFFAASRREARAGAKVVVWPEINALVFQEDEAGLLARARQLAREEHIHLLMGMGTIRVGEQRLLENKAVLIDPSGAELLSYRKSAAVPGFEAQKKVPGDWRIVTSDTPHGRVATAICYDLDFPSFIRQVGLTGADLLLVPSNDWEAIKQMHLVPAVFRAVENGVAIVRATSRGVSAAVDPLGRVLATMDHFATTERVMVAQVPMVSVRTVYVRFGDWFAWLCVAGLLTMIGWSFLHARRVR